MIKWRRYLRPLLFLIAGLFIFLRIDTLLCVPFLMLSLFFFATDVSNVNKRLETNKNLPEEFDGSFGMLGNYVVDGTESYGLFVELLNMPVFVDIRLDEFAKEREFQAEFLSKNKVGLERSLSNFMEANPKYKSRRISYIGLHSKNLEQGEVFWNPDGYTILRGMQFFVD